MSSGDNADTINLVSTPAFRGRPVSLLTSTCAGLNKTQTDLMLPHPWSTQYQIIAVEVDNIQGITSLVYTLILQSYHGPSIHFGS